MGDADSWTPSFADVPVAGGELRVASWGEGAGVVLGIHGITGSCLQLKPVARRLGPEFTMVAPDLRGRGGSNRLPPPYGLQSHADDCAAVIAHFSSRPVVVLGESLGGFVAVVLAGSHPELVERLVLADGGLPTPVPAGVDTGALLQAVIGPAIDRLGQVFPSKEAYLEFWRSHPALAAEWSSDLEDYLEYDLEASDAGFVSRARIEPVRADGADILTDSSGISAALKSLHRPMTLVRARRNLVDALPPLYPDEVVDEWRPLLGEFSDEIVEDTNHYTLMFGERGAACLAGHVAGGAGRAPG
ncbi:MAG TPA: alpha/beta hydrolase [Acidimicrobiales bacterium]|nr:alpha/beta hydrolase [Acidimicrobiales bacterium]